MRAIKSKNTDAERALFAFAKSVWPYARYRKHAKIHKVTVDLWFPGKKIAVFADGDFWHGRDYEKRKEKFGAYWIAKISANIERDIRQTELLRSRGVTVVRIWRSEILRKSTTAFEPLKMLLGLTVGTSFEEGQNIA